MFHYLQELALSILFPPSCRTCGTDGVWLCTRCIKTATSLRKKAPVHGIDQLFSLGSYDHPVLQEAVQQLKYSGGRVLCQPLAQELAARFRHDLNAAVIVPVPLHPSRERVRGFNQSQLLGLSLAQLLDIPELDLVERTRNTVPQVNLNEEERLVNVREAFALASTLESIPKSGIIIDDVFTTGATMSEVARVLRAAGMEHITAVTVAKG